MAIQIITAFQAMLGMLRSTLHLSPRPSMQRTENISPHLSKSFVRSCRFLIKALDVSRCPFRKLAMHKLDYPILGRHCRPTVVFQLTVRRRWLSDEENPAASPRPGSRVRDGKANYHPDDGALRPRKLPRQRLAQSRGWIPHRGTFPHTRARPHRAPIHHDSPSPAAPSARHRLRARQPAVLGHHQPEHVGGPEPYRGRSLRDAVAALQLVLRLLPRRRRPRLRRPGCGVEDGRVGAPPRRAPEAALVPARQHPVVHARGHERHEGPVARRGHALPRVGPRGAELHRAPRVGARVGWHAAQVRGRRVLVPRPGRAVLDGRGGGRVEWRECAAVAVCAGGGAGGREPGESEAEVERCAYGGGGVRSW